MPYCSHYCIIFIFTRTYFCTVITAVSVIAVLPFPLVITQRYFCPSLPAVTGTLTLAVVLPSMEDALHTDEFALQYCH